MRALIAAAALLAALPLHAASVPLARVEGVLPDPTSLVLTLHAGEIEKAAAGEYQTERFILGSVVIPTRGPAQVRAAKESSVWLGLRLADVPEAVLDLPERGLPVRWEGRQGDRRLAVAGVIDLGRNATLDVPEDVRRQFGRLGPVQVTPGLSAVGVRALLDVLNPFSFDLVATRMSYRLVIGGQRVASDERSGFRLRAGQRSDVLIEQTVMLADVAGALPALLGQQRAAVDGSVVLRTPNGEREFEFGVAGR